MSISIQYEGFDELIKECEKLATPREIENTDRSALKKIGAMAQKGAASNMPRSKDVAKSGRKGSRTFKHAADNIPVKIVKKQGKLMCVVGWDKGDISPYFYTKFLEWGTSIMPPVAPFKRTFIQQRREWDKIFEEEYTKLVERLGG